MAPRFPFSVLSACAASFTTRSSVARYSTNRLSPLGVMRQSVWERRPAEFFQIATRPASTRIWRWRLRFPSDDALADRSPAELTQFAERKGIDVPQELSPDALADHILEQWSAGGTISPYTPTTVGLACLAACAGFIATYGLSRKGASLRNRSSI